MRHFCPVFGVAVVTVTLYILLYTLGKACGITGQRHKKAGACLYDVALDNSLAVHAFGVIVQASLH